MDKPERPHTPTKRSVKQVGLKHSELGITSIGLFVVSCLFAVVALVIAVVIAANLDGSRQRRGGHEGLAMIGFTSFIVGSFFNLVGAVCGLVGLVQPQRKRKPAAWGLGLNIMLPLVNIIMIPLIARGTWP